MKVSSKLSNIPYHFLRKQLNQEADLKVEQSLKRINEVKKQVEDYREMYLNQLYEVKKLVRVYLFIY